MPERSIVLSPEEVIEIVADLNHLLSPEEVIEIVADLNHIVDGLESADELNLVLLADSISNRLSQS